MCISSFAGDIMITLGISINNILVSLVQLEGEKLDNKIKYITHRIKKLRLMCTSQNEINNINQLDEQLDVLLSILNQQ